MESYRYLVQSWGSARSETLFNDMETAVSAYLHAPLMEEDSRELLMGNFTRSSSGYIRTTFPPVLLGRME
jgi:hypothetical protein